MGRRCLLFWQCWRACRTLLHTARSSAAMCSCQRADQQVHNNSPPSATAPTAESEAEEGSEDDFKSAKKAKKAGLKKKKAAPGSGGAKKGKQAKKGGLPGWRGCSSHSQQQPAHLPHALCCPAQYCCQPCIAYAEEEEEDSGEDFQEAKPKARPAAKKPAAAASGALAKKPAPARDRAFEDGGLDAGGEPALVVWLLPLLRHVMCESWTACVGCASAPCMHPAAPCLCLPAGCAADSSSDDDVPLLARKVKK